MTPATVTAELIEHSDGRPVAYIDATAVAVFAYQQPDGIYVIDVYTRDDTAPDRLRLRLDGTPLTAARARHRVRPASRRARSRSRR